MLSGRNPLKNDKQECATPEQMPQRMNMIIKDNGRFIKKYEDKGFFSPTAYDLIEKLLRYDPELRIGCREMGVIEIK